jgi:hypothetical protein
VTRIALRPAIKENAQLQGNGLPACLVKGKQEQHINGFRIQKPLEHPVAWHYGRETTNAGTSAGKTISKVNYSIDAENQQFFPVRKMLRT